MNFKDVLKFYRERVIVLDDNEYGIELVAFRRNPTSWFWANKKKKVLNICGLKDWKIPTMEELRFIVSQSSFEEISSMFEVRPENFMNLSDKEPLSLLWSSDICRDVGGVARKEIFVYDYKKQQQCIIFDNCLLSCCYIRYADK